MEDKKSVWPYALKYGTMMGFISIALSILFYFIFPFDPQTMETKSRWMQTLVTLIVIGIMLYIGTKSFRDEELGGQMTYGGSVSFALAMSVPFLILTGIYMFIFFNFIEPDFISKATEKQYQAMSEKGMSDEDIERAMQRMSFMRSTGFFTLFGVIGAFIQVLIVSLITSIFTKKETTLSANQ